MLRRNEHLMSAAEPVRELTPGELIAELIDRRIATNNSMIVAALRDLADTIDALSDSGEGTS